VERSQSIRNTCLTDFLEVIGVTYPALSQEYHPRPPEVFRRYINKEIIRRSEDQQRQCAVSLEASSLATVALTTSIRSVKLLPVLGKVIEDESPAVCKNSSPSFNVPPALSSRFNEVEHGKRDIRITFQTYGAV